MKRKSKNPLFFPGILKAISQLQQSKGATEAKILDYIQRLMLVINPSSNTQKVHNLPQQVRRALKHAQKLGLVMQKGGRYLLAINPVKNRLHPASKKSCKPNIYLTRFRTSTSVGKTNKVGTVKARRSSTQPDKACGHCRKNKRRRAKSRQNRSRRRRRHAGHGSLGSLDDKNEIVSSEESFESN
ncbi:unnamed protein product [Acanthoscelides obtectus]|uniref:H15 domain-containing protein n=1 Tax=Acanthoscelides obtectus TaxID=200917 RepID=A0A9P0NX13_ACAOB|nr:unnamed protein product [Acanthoscelides obtectus]CAK1637344.1 hypothetical protein AOBTE_LOCUS9925 [Acanthoscelides obtectus]